MSIMNLRYLSPRRSRDLSGLARKMERKGLGNEVNLSYGWDNPLPGRPLGPLVSIYARVSSVRDEKVHYREPVVKATPVHPPISLDGSHLHYILDDGPFEISSHAKGLAERVEASGLVIANASLIDEESLMAQMDGKPSSAGKVL